MAAVADTKIYTPEDLLRIPDGERYELVDEEVLPGFRCRVGDLFPPQTASPGAA